MPAYFTRIDRRGNAWRMETTELAPGYIVSRLTKGHWQLAARHGPDTDRAEALEAMRRFVEAGITNFDCADHYLGTEEMIGAFRASHPRLAASLRVQTKLVPDRDMLAGLRRRDLEAIIDRSLARLGAERLDMVQFHWWDYASGDYAQAMGWLAEMRREGKIELLGTTNFDCPSLRRILDSGVPVASNQLQYSLLDRRPEHGMVDLARERGVALQCYGTVAGGFLSRHWLGVPPPEVPFANRSLVKYRLIIDEFGGWALFQELLSALDAIARKHRVSIAAVATRAILDRPHVATAIVGARTSAHLDDLLAIDTLRLDAADLAAIAGVTERAHGPNGDCYAIEREPGGAHSEIMWKNQNVRGVGAR